MTKSDGIEEDQVAVLWRELEAIHAVNVIYWSNKKRRTSAAVAEYELRKERLEVIRWEVAKLRWARVTESSSDLLSATTTRDNIKHKMS
jgi:hypothetical protein